MSRSITVTTDVADALEAASSYNENGEQSFAATTSAAAIGGGLLTLLPMLLQLLPVLLSLFKNAEIKKLLTSLPDLLAAVKAGDWGKVITILVTALGVPMPTPTQVHGSMGPG